MKRIKFSVEPYLGALPLRFNMMPSEVASIMGPPSKTNENGREIEEFRWTKDAPRCVSYTSSRRLIEIAFHSENNVKFRDIDLCHTRNLIVALEKYDDEPMEFSETIVFLKLGIAFSAHDNDAKDRGVGVFRKDRWKKFLSQLTPYKAK